MKKNPAIKIIFAVLFVITRVVLSQDFNLFNPPSEIYLFSSFDEGAEGFKYNPAVLGLKHLANGKMIGFFQNTGGKVRLSNFDFYLNTGILGLGYSFAQPTYESSLFTAQPTSAQNTFSLGLGFGNKTISGGLLFELVNASYYSTQISVSESKSNFRGGLGILFRPLKILSTSFTAKSNQAYSPLDQQSVKYTIGASLRPFPTNRITLLSEFGFLPQNDFGIDFYDYKLGLEGKPFKGVSLRAVYQRIHHPDSHSDLFSLGVSFDFPHASVSYSNPIVKSSNSSGDDIYLSQGNEFSLSFNLEKKQSVVKDPKKVLEITLSGSLQDFHTEDVFFGLLGHEKRSIHEVIADIDYAAADPTVKGMLLKIYPISSGRFEISAGIEELCASLDRFKKRGKHITAYIAQDAGPGEYYISTFADDIVMPQDALFFYGLNIQIFNYRQFLQKYGIELQNFYAGDYKLVFQGILDSTTEQGKEVINRILDIIYEKMLSRVITARNLIVDDYLRDKLSKPLSGKEAERLGLVDKNGWYEDAKNMAKNEGKTKNLTRALNRSEWDYDWSEPEQIAIIGVYGTIKPGESEGPSGFVLPIPYIGGGRATGSETTVRQLEDAFSSPKVKAVILRVSSGGGSALASGEINDAIARLKKKYKKPFIVSMGDAAASGGYLVSVNADKIFSDELTITGSIGVWASIPNFDSLVTSQKIKVEVFKRGESSDISSFFRKLDQEDIETIQGLINFYYDRFIEDIIAARKFSKDDAEKIAKGRVWLGTDAFNKRLVDEIGGLYESLIYAKKKARLGKRFKLVYYSVPGAISIDVMVSKSIVDYLQTNLTSLLGIDDPQQYLEIKY